MKTYFLSFLALVLACVAAVVLMGSVRAPKATAENEFTLATAKPAQTPTVATAPRERTVEQARKNIKVLNGMPDSQLIPVMNYFAASVGHRCNFCHVNDNGQWDFASDAKPEKNTAREMIQMVLNVNKTTFKGNLEVSCYTCHRGTNHPLSAPILPLPLPSPPPATPGAAASAGSNTGATTATPPASPSPHPQLPTADELLTKYIAAVGGQPAIDRIKSRAAKGTLAAANGNTGTFEIIQVAPDKGYESFVTQRGSLEHAVTPNAGWEKNPQGVRELAGQQLTDLRLSMQLFRNLKLKEQYSSMRVVGREKISEHDAYAVRAARSENDVERLYFDVDSGLLLRRITYLRTMIGIIPDQTDFEDYRDVEGVKFPFTIRVSSVDAGNPYSIRTLTEIKINAPTDESKFNMPPAAKP